MKILGINFGHDASLALFIDGRMIAFEELERRTRHKHQWGITADDVERFLGLCNLQMSDIDAIGICGTQGWAVRHDENIQLLPGWQNVGLPMFSADAGVWPKGCGFDGDDRLELYERHAHFKVVETPSVVRRDFSFPFLHGPDVDAEQLSRLVSDTMRDPAGRMRETAKSMTAPLTYVHRGRAWPAFFVEHHACHAFYAHMYSGAENSVICTHDGGAPVLPFNSGGIYLSLAGIGAIPIVTHNLGLGVLYDQVSDAVGLVNEPGKLMGLAPYATASPAVFGLVAPALEAYRALSWAKVCELTQRVLEISKSDRAIRRQSIAKFGLKLADPDLAIQVAANAQLLVQTIFTTVVGKVLIQIAEQAPHLSTVDLTGGFTFNCPSNSLLQQQYPSIAVNPLPGAGDTGLPIGAAALISSMAGEKVRREIHTSGLTAAFPPLPAKSVALKPDPHRVAKVDTAGATIPDFIARNVAAGKVMCVFRGRSEVGPRALGNRSIIATATDGAIRDRINILKGRELWRPLAPICREEDFNDYFDGDPRLARYMLFTFRVHSPALPAITHVDGTARVQCITETDRWLHPALTKLKESGKHPVIINTSFNCAGEPLVETLDQAIASFLKMKLDYLVTEDAIYAATT